VVTRHLDTEHIETATLYELTNLGRSPDEPLAAKSPYSNSLVEKSRSKVGW
jgi:hypothetical protein